MQPSDFLCDFCEQAWSESTPFVEGHHGSCICGRCLTVAVVSLRNAATERAFESASAASPAAATSTLAPCTMCLEPRDEPHWPSPKREARICARCIDQAVRVLSKDRSSGWSPPS